MIKRILGLVLCLTMILSTATIGLSAVSYKPTVDLDGKTYTDEEGLIFKVITNDAEAGNADDAFSSAIEAGSNIILDGDITLTGSYEPKNGVVIDGNGYTIQTEERATALFSFTQGGIVTIRNVNFGSSEEPIVTGNTALFAEDKTNRTIWENVGFYVNNTGAVGYVKDSTPAFGTLFTCVYGVQEFYGCTLGVSLTSAASGSLFAGWFGEMKNSGSNMAQVT